MRISWQIKCMELNRLISYSVIEGLVLSQQKLQTLFYPKINPIQLATVELEQRAAMSVFYLN